MAAVNDLSFRVHHAMLPMADLDRSIAFYTRLLGMKVKERHASEARKVEVGSIGYGDEASAPFLELIKDTSERAPARMTPANIHVGIDTSDLRKLCDVLEKEGVTFIHPFKQRSDGMGFSAWVRDPDGHELDSPNDIRAHNRVAAACNLVRAAGGGHCVTPRAR